MRIRPEDFGGPNTGRPAEDAAVRAAVADAIPGAVVVSVDPVDLRLSCSPEPCCTVTWDQPTPDPVARLLYGPEPCTSDLWFRLAMPDCLATKHSGALSR